VKWERYKVGEQTFRFVSEIAGFDSKSNVCIEQETSKYAAYAEGTVYGLNISINLNTMRGLLQPKKKFDEASFKGGMREVKTSLKTEQETNLIKTTLKS
jgi:hypothetical protein